MLFVRQQKKIPVSPDSTLIISVREYISKNFQPDKREFVPLFLSQRKRSCVRTEVGTRDCIQTEKTADRQECVPGEKTAHAGMEAKPEISGTWKQTPVSVPKQCQQSVSQLQKSYEPEFCSDSAHVTEEFLEQRRRSLEKIIQNVGESFQARLLRLIDERGWTDVQAYKKAGKDKKLFHKIRSNPAYQPSKHTVFAFALGLELSVDETVDLLASAGFAFSPGSRFDLIVKYALEQKLYDLYTVDCILYELGEEEYFCCQK